MKLGTAEIIRGDARHLPLADDSVDLVVTSPPYFALRSYQDGGEHYPGQIGDEATPAEFVAALLEVTRECVRVLKPSGSLWVNLGDKYSRGSRPLAQPDQFRGPGQCITYDDPKYVKNLAPEDSGVAGKSLIGIPWRYALACIDDLGLILRAEVIWSKPNGLPESVTDRVRRSHEQWFHFTLQPRYFSAVDEIREPQLRTGGTAPEGRYMAASGNGVTHREYQPNAYFNPLGKLPGSVWTVPTEPLRVPDHLGIDHFAAFPTTWPKRIIQGWSPAGVCVECGEGRRPVAERASAERHNGGRHGPTGLSPDNNHGTGASTLDIVPDYRITGYACACLAPTAATTPSVILDPFGGTGTVAMVAKALGRHGISVDMSADYCRLAEWRTNDRDQLAKVLGVAKAEQQDDDQLDMFDLIEETA